MNGERGVWIIRNKNSNVILNKNVYPWADKNEVCLDSGSKEIVVIWFHGIIIIIF